MIAGAVVVPLVSLIYLLTIDWRLTLITLAPVALAVALVRSSRACPTHCWCLPATLGRG
ncbi:hypothetical protein AB0I53_18675 [Saccharopolyspora sp. NPDC050389]|uniref:hypothetical protein n=1 Tax=Saccharopolyspora sp. NPDC050389 TaxID=3155516 RepID=UPI0033ED85B4